MPNCFVFCQQFLIFPLKVTHFLCNKKILLTIDWIFNQTKLSIETHSVTHSKQEGLTLPKAFLQSASALVQGLRVGEQGLTLVLLEFMMGFMVILSGMGESTLQ